MTEGALVGAALPLVAAVLAAVVTAVLAVADVAEVADVAARDATGTIARQPSAPAAAKIETRFMNRPFPWHASDLL